MENIDVRGVPEVIAEAMAAMADYFRKQPAEGTKETQRPPVKLSVRPGKVLGSLRREDLYGDRI